MNKVAMLIALVATLLGAASLILYKKRFEETAIGGDRVAILVTTSEIPLGSRLSQKSVGTRLVPELFLDRRQILATEMDRVIGVPFRTQMAADESILWTDLATSNAASRGLALRIPASMRAVAVEASARSAFGGLLRPGDRVDVLLTGNRLSANDSRVTKTLEQNVLVLAIGGSLSGGSSGRGSNTISLLVTPTQAQNLIFAEDRGKVSLTLRNPDDISTIEKIPDVTAEKVLQRGPSTSRPRNPSSRVSDDKLIEEALKQIKGNQPKDKPRGR